MIWVFEYDEGSAGDNAISVNCWINCLRFDRFFEICAGFEYVADFGPQIWAKEYLNIKWHWSFENQNNPTH